MNPVRFHLTGLTLEERKTLRYSMPWDAHLWLEYDGNAQPIMVVQYANKEIQND